MRIAGLLILTAMVLPGEWPAQAQDGSGTAQVTFSATSANVKDAGAPVKIQILRWSTDEERAQLIAALNVPARRGGPPPGGVPAGGGRGARGAAGRVGRGGDAAAVPLTPIQTLSAAIARQPTIGYVWTPEVTGYAIKYAYRMPLEAGERIIVATDRRLGVYTDQWRLVAPVGATDYDFTLFEIRLDAKGVGNATASLASKVVVDDEAKTIALETGAASPAILQNITRR
jgi:hypothetical protein